MRSLTNNKTPVEGAFADARYWIFAYDAALNRGVRIGWSKSRRRAVAAIPPGGWVFDRNTRAKFLFGGKAA